MAIFDCFQYFNEEHIVDLRLNILDQYVDNFVIVESTVNHQGEIKKLNFDINKYTKFKKKINYIIVEDTPENIKRPHVGGESLVEQHQRNSLMRGLKRCHDEDLVILSDVDEIPDLSKLNQVKNIRYKFFKINIIDIKKVKYKSNSSLFSKLRINSLIKS